MSSNIGASKASENVWTISNVITLARICLVPVFVVALLSPWPEWFGVLNVVSDPIKAVVAAVIFAVISCTDWIDGYLARSRNEVTDLGKFLDPLADKILVAAALIALVELQALPSWPVLIILSREFIVSGLRMLAASRGYVIAASWYGKAKTVTQIIAILMFLVKDYVIEQGNVPSIENPFYICAWAMMAVALILTILSMLDYIAKAMPLLSATDKGDVAKGVACDEDDEGDEGAKPMICEGAQERAAKLISMLKDREMSICTAESLTGGLICAALTSVPGSSDAVKGSFVTYATSSKSAVLGVQKSLLKTNGPVDPYVAEEMAEFSARKLDCEMSVSATGIAGPGGAEPGKPVGTVFIGVFHKGVATSHECHFQGDRKSVRDQTVAFAIQACIDTLS